MTEYTATRDHWEVTSRDVGPLTVAKSRTRQGAWGVGLEVVEHAVVLTLGTHQLWFTTQADYWFRR